MKADPMEKVDSRLFDINYKSPENIAYLIAMLEQVWGVDRISLLMHAALNIRIQQMNQEIQ